MKNVILCKINKTWLKPRLRRKLYCTFHLDRNKRIFKIIIYILNINFYLFELGSKTGGIIRPLA